MSYPHDLPSKTKLVEETLERAISREQVVHFTYFKRPGFGNLRTLSPYIVDDEFGTVIGWDHGKGELRRFSLAKIAWPVEPQPGKDYVQPST